MSNFKKVNRYQVRHYPTPTSFSVQVGFKGKLLDYKSARKIVRKLKIAGVDAFTEKFEINIIADKK